MPLNVKVFRDILLHMRTLQARFTLCKGTFQHIMWNGKRSVEQRSDDDIAEQLRPVIKGAVQGVSISEFSGADAQIGNSDQLVTSPPVAGSAEK